MVWSRRSKRRVYSSGCSPYMRTHGNHHASSTRILPRLQTRVTHPWLQFPDGSPGAKRLATLLKKKYAATWTVDWDTLEMLNLHDRARDMMGPVWLRFFSIEHPQYRELCLEFLSTYEFQTPCTDYSYGGSITFRLAGIERSCSLIEFASRMDLYTDEEMETDMFLKGLTKFPGEVSPQQFWAQIGEGPYEKNLVKGTKLRDPFHRIIHRIIAQSIAGRKEHTFVITKKDLFLLYCFIKPAVCNVAYMLASYFKSCKGKSPTTYICGGSYITQLAKSYDVLTPEACATLTCFLPTQTIDMVVLKNMKIVERLWQPEPSQHEEAPHQLQEEIPKQQDPLQPEEAPQHQPPPQHEAPIQQHPVKQEEAPEQQDPLQPHDAPQEQHQPQPQEGHQQQQEEGPQQQHADPSHCLGPLGVTTLDLVAMVTELQQGQQRLEQEHQRRHQETMSALRCIASYFAIPDFPQP